MKNLLYKLKVCWIVLNSKGFIFIPSNKQYQMRVKMGPKGQVLGFNADGNGGYIFGCTLIQQTPLNLHEQGFHTFDGTEHKVN